MGVHELALEDVTRPHERPRCDAYAGYYFIAVYAAEHTAGGFLAGAEPVLGRSLISSPFTAGLPWCTLFGSLVDGYFTVQDHGRRSGLVVTHAAVLSPCSNTSRADFCVSHGVSVRLRHE